MKTLFTKKFVLAGLLALNAASVFAGQPPNITNLGLNAQLDGKQQVPAVVTDGKGTFFANTTGTKITYQLNTSNLSSNVVEAHIHLAQPGVNGGLMVILCAPNVQQVNPCPSDTKGKMSIGGTIFTDTPTAALPGVPNQGITTPVNFLKVLQAFREGNAYVNIHTQNIDGEIRGQIKTGGGLPTHS